MITPSKLPNLENGLLWLYKMVSGALIFLILGMHLVVNHLVAPGGLLSYRDVVNYLKKPPIFIMETVFVCCVVSHSLFGIRSIILDLNPSPRLMTWLDRFFIVFGSLAAVYGVWLLLAVSRG
jgi:succinate dehydrogenase hydrophobic anchor subunit